MLDTVNLGYWVKNSSDNNYSSALRTTYNWFVQHTYVEASAVAKVGTYFDLGLKYAVRASLGEYRETGYSISNRDGFKSINN